MARQLAGERILILCLNDPLTGSICNFYFDGEQSGQSHNQWRIQVERQSLQVRKEQWTKLFAWRLARIV